ncbi:MAG: mechanosensitive ion channel family protein [Proteobacteria bacterium]|nr:mechanosensitive ion channel family protein [Pseudomonadota bacterium]
MHHVLANQASFWQHHLSTIVGISVALVLGVAGTAVSRMVMRLLVRWAGNHNRAFTAAIVSALMPPVFVTIWGLAIYFMALALADPLHLSGFLRVLPIMLKTVVLLTVGWAALRVTSVTERAYPAHLQLRRGRAPDPMLVDALGKIARILVVAIIGLMLLRAMNFSIASLLAFGGVAGIAVGFAAQGVTANLFGAFVVYLDQPFKVGEWIVLPAQNVFGTVEHIGWRTTTLRGFDTRPYYVPNQIFNSSVVQTPPRMHARRISETMSIRYVDFDKLSAIVAECRDYVANCPEVDHQQSEMIFFSKFGNHALEIMIYCFAKTHVWKESLAIQERLLIQLGWIVRSHGAELAVPISQVEITSSPTQLEARREPAHH